MAKFTKLIKDGNGSGGGGEVAKEAVTAVISQAKLSNYTYPAVLYEISDPLDPYNSKVKKIGDIPKGTTSSYGKLQTTLYTNTYYMVVNETLGVPSIMLDHIECGWVSNRYGDYLIFYFDRVGKGTSSQHIPNNFYFYVVDDE